MTGDKTAAGEVDGPEVAGVALAALAMAPGGETAGEVEEVEGPEVAAAALAMTPGGEPAREVEGPEVAGAALTITPGGEIGSGRAVAITKGKASEDPDTK